MLVADRVSKSFGSVRAVRDVSFALQSGAVVGLLGPNGAGKSTTIRMLTGFLPPDAGRVLVDGLDTVEQAAAARARLGYLPENAPLYPEMSVRAYLDFRGRLFGLARRERLAAVARVVDRCWLSSVVGRRIGQLSKGYRQRVGLAAALLHDPRVIILDEPTNALDPTQVIETRRLIGELAQGRTVLLSSHVLSEVERTCQRVLILIGGELLADGSPAELVRQSPEPTVYRVEFRGSASWLEGCRPPGLTPWTVTTEGGWTRGVASGSGGDVREAIAAAARAAGVDVRELTGERPTLERVFVGLLERRGSARPAA